MNYLPGLFELAYLQNVGRCFNLYLMSFALSGHKRIILVISFVFHESLVCAKWVGIHTDEIVSLFNCIVSIVFSILLLI